MRFAVISNVQANLTALRAVLEALDVQGRPVERIVCAGDVVGLGPQPNEVLDLLRERQIEIVRGNYDEAVAFDRDTSGVDFPDDASEQLDQRRVAWTREALTEDNLQYLRSLPKDIRLTPTGVERNTEDRRLAEHRRMFFLRALVGGLAREAKMPGRQVLLVHGSPRAINELVLPDSANSILATIASAAQADVLVSGHAGVGFRREASGVTFVGVGSVSGSRSGPGEAEYAVLSIGKEIDVDFDVAAYDEGQEAAAVRDSGMPGPVPLG
jgi:predicted phosphodiesterase